MTTINSIEPIVADNSLVKETKSKIVFKDLEQKYETYLDKTQVTIFRLDGHEFSKLTSKFKKPFDDGFTRAMKQTALKAFEYYKFSLGFVGSDEITFCIFPKETKNGDPSDIEFSGRLEKMTTLLAGFVSVVFYKEFSKEYPMENLTPHFDCRVYQVPCIKDALDNISERITYTLKNSRMMFAQSHFSANKLHKLSSNKAIELVLDEKAIDYYQVASTDNRIGSVILTKRIDCDKEVMIDGVAKIFRFKRNSVQFVNLSSTKVLDLTFE